MGIESLTQEIIHDNLSGSQDLTTKAGRLVLRLLQEKKHSPSEELSRDVLEIGSQLLRAQPAMASLFNLFNRILSDLNKAPDGLAAAKDLHRATETYIREMKEHNRSISAHLFHRVRTKDTILIYSSSRSVTEALFHCWKKGKRFSVICSESRPTGEGTLLARRLATQGIPTSLTTDALALSLMTAPPESKRRVSLALVGADSVSLRGLTNKSGTLCLAIVAKHCSVPFYALAGSEKFLPSNYPIDNAIQDKPPEEILAHPPRGLKIINRYFDLTPLSYLTALITEKGPLSPLEIKRQLKKLTFHPRLTAALKKVNSQK